jgi:hypothetical protein
MAGSPQLTNFWNALFLPRTGNCLAVLYFPAVFGCKRLFQAVLDEEDISNGVCEQRGVWFKILPFHKSLTVHPDWLVHRKKYRDMGIGVRLTPAQRHEISMNFGPHTFQKCPFCRVLMARDQESSFDTVCTICSTYFCWNCAVPHSGKFGWRAGSSAHEPTCAEYRHCAPGAEPLYVQRRLEEENFAEQSKLQLCLALAESLQWPSLLQKPPKRLADMGLLSSDNRVSHAWSIARRNSLDGILCSWGAFLLCFFVWSLSSVFRFYVCWVAGFQHFGSLLCCMPRVHCAIYEFYETKAAR